MGDTASKWLRGVPGLRLDLTEDDISEVNHRQGSRRALCGSWAGRGGPPGAGQGGMYPSSSFAVHLRRPQDRSYMWPTGKR